MFSPITICKICSQKKKKKKNDTDSFYKSIDPEAWDAEGSLKK